MPKRVVVVRDTYSPLWVIRCPEPCEADGWCMGRTDERGMRTMPARWMCWLGSGQTEKGARAEARRLGYEVVG